MGLNIKKELATMEGMTPSELSEKYLNLFDEETRSRNKSWLIKRIAWRLQENEEGGLSERAKRRAAELANESDLRLNPPKLPPTNGGASKTLPFKSDADNRLPMPSSTVSRTYKGQEITVKVLEEGFEYEGEAYRSLSAIAKAVTGSHWNGYKFFGLTKGGAA